MQDKYFQKFNHLLPCGSSINSTGTNIFPDDNYRPDVSIKKSNGDVHLVLESEQKTDRKAFIGTMVHACRYAEYHEKDLILIVVMKETKNQATVAQVSSNIKPYYDWLKELGVKYLTDVLFISDDNYIESNNANELILSQEFKQRCTPI